jgi:hypothetical protein
LSRVSSFPSWKNHWQFSDKSLLKSIIFDRICADNASLELTFILGTKSHQKCRFDASKSLVKNFPRLIIEFLLELSTFLTPFSFLSILFPSRFCCVMRITSPWNSFMKWGETLGKHSIWKSRESLILFSNSLFFSVNDLTVGWMRENFSLPMSLKRERERERERKRETKFSPLKGCPVYEKESVHDMHSCSWVRNLMKCSWLSSSDSWSWNFETCHERKVSLLLQKKRTSHQESLYRLHVFSDVVLQIKENRRLGKRENVLKRGMNTWMKEKEIETPWWATYEGFHELEVVVHFLSSFESLSGTFALNIPFFSSQFLCYFLYKVYSSLCVNSCMTLTRHFLTNFCFFRKRFFEDVLGRKSFSQKEHKRQKRTSKETRFSFLYFFVDSEGKEWSLGEWPRRTRRNTLLFPESSKKDNKPSKKRDAKDIEMSERWTETGRGCCFFEPNEKSTFLSNTLMFQ